MSRRIERIAHLIRGVVAEGIQTRLSDPRISPLTSVTQVEVSPDFSSAHIHVSVMAEPVQQKLTLTALRHAAGRLRSIVAERIEIRHVPWLTFHLDESIQRAMQTVDQLDRLMRESGQTPALSVAEEDEFQERPGAATSEADEAPAPHVPAAAQPDDREVR